MVLWCGALLVKSKTKLAQIVRIVILQLTFSGCFVTTEYTEPTRCFFELGENDESCELPKEISAGNEHTCVIRENKSVACWGVMNLVNLASKHKAFALAQVTTLARFPYSQTLLKFRPDIGTPAPSMMTTCIAGETTDKGSRVLNLIITQAPKFLFPKRLPSHQPH